MDLSSANQLASFVRWHRDKRLWILDEDGTLDIGLHAGRVERSTDWSIICIAASGSDGEGRVLRLDRIAAVKVELSDDESRYFGDRRRMVEIEVDLGLEAARHENLAGRHRAALQRSQEALDLVARELGPDDAIGAKVMAGVADALRRLGRYAEAQERIDVACQRARPGGEFLASILHVAASLYADTGELERARGLARECLGLIGEGHQRAEALATLSLIECRRGRFAEAERIAGEGLRLAIDPVTRARLQHHAGMAACLAGRIESARALLVESHAERGRVLGRAHPDTIEGSASLATLSLIAGDVQGAVSRYREVLAEAEAILGPDHIRVADYAVNLAVALRKAGGEGARSEAAELLERSRRIRRLCGA